MAKKKKNQTGGQQFLSPEEFMRQRMRQLPIGKCYITDDVPDDVGLYHIIVTRRHTGGRISMASFLTDMFCLGVKDSYYDLRMEEYELEDMLNETSDRLVFRECSYEEAHNRIYGAIAFAQEAGIKPHKSFAISRYMLEEDTDDVPLIEYDYGLNGRHHLAVATQLEASQYLPLLRKHLGEGNFTYIIGNSSSVDGDDDYYPDDEPLTVEMLAAKMEMDELRFAIDVLDFEIDKNQADDAVRSQYAAMVLEKTSDVLLRLPGEELGLLETKKCFKLQGNIIPAQFNYNYMFLERFCLAEGYWEDDDLYVIRLADDFAEAALPLVEKIKDDDLNKVRMVVEGIVEGMANLYGLVTLADVKKRLSSVLDMQLFKDKEFESVVNILLGMSPLLISMACSLDKERRIEELPDDEIFFASRYGWADNGRLVEEIARRDDRIKERVDYTIDEILMAASNPLPSIPNAEQDDFEHFLANDLGYESYALHSIVFNLWYRAQHEGDDDFEEEPYFRYYASEVLGEAPKKPNRKTLDKGMDLLQRFMNAMPRWTLKGHAPCDI